MRRIAIISKPGKEELKVVLPELVRWLGERGFEPILDSTSGDYTRAGRIVHRAQMAEESPELAVVLGGDGTLLAAARVFAKSGIPIMSVNLGSLGFLTEVRLADLYTTLNGWCSSCCTIETRAMLHAELFRHDELHCEYEALNDVVIAKGAIARMGDFTVLLDTQLAATFRADGVIVATPTGSTAYSLAAAGPILTPSVDALVITPICPHLLTLRPMVVRGDARLVVRVEGIPDQTFLTVDGQEAIQVHVGDELHCRRSDYGVKLVRMGGTEFFDVLRSKLKWGER
ncbi:MAG TPA: NAD(+)/NADH kinase [Acidisarcina sp.]